MVLRLSKKDETRIRTETYGTADNKLNNILIELYNENSKPIIKMLRDSRNHFKSIGICYHCHKKLVLENMKSDKDETEIQMQCFHCLSITKDSSKETIHYIKEINKLIRPYGSDMTDGYPNLFDVDYENR